MVDAEKVFKALEFVEKRTNKNIYRYVLSDQVSGNI